MKRIVAWVNKVNKRQLEKEGLDIYFASSLEDFEANLTLDCIAVFSLSLAASTFKKTRALTRGHSDIKFYFLEKVRIDMPLTVNEMSVRWDDNCSTHGKWPCCIAVLSRGHSKGVYPRCVYRCPALTGNPGK